MFQHVIFGGRAWLKLYKWLNSKCFPLEIALCINYTVLIDISSFSKSYFWVKDQGSNFVLDNVCHKFGHLKAAEDIFLQ